MAIPPADTVFDERSAFTAARLAEFRGEVAQIDLLKKYPGLCIYITGSYGRREASDQSDLDLFFINGGDGKGGNQVSRLDQFMLFAKLVAIAEQLEYQEFSNDGEYLKIHNLDDIQRELGGQHDDSQNHFTARLLLLLESQFVYNENTHRHVVKECLGFYYRDFHDHVNDFRATFLVNDILRFWKTFCLNYENKRNRKDAAKRDANHLKNLKLKFSRLWTCFSMILCLARDRQRLTEPQVQNLIAMSPRDRVLHAIRERSELSVVADQLFEDYAWFLVMTGKPKAETLDWIAAPMTRDEAFRRADGFGSRMYKILNGIADSETNRFLVM